MDYKNTLLLPKTDFPMRAELPKREPALLAKWRREKIYDQIMTARQDQIRFVLHDGPPFANGDAHMGHALNMVLKDIVLKYQNMSGHYAPFVPGWDCHGLPIEHKVMKELGAAETDPIKIREKCESTARHWAAVQSEQFQRLGVFGDWEHPYMTLDPAYEAETLRVFATLVAKDFVYQGLRPVHWSTGCQTALAEAEIEYKEKVDPAIYVKFPVRSLPPGKFLNEPYADEFKGTSLLIWTTTPWTLPANLAVAVAPNLDYAIYDVGGQKLLFHTNLLPSVAAAVAASTDSQKEFGHPELVEGSVQPPPSVVASGGPDNSLAGLPQATGGSPKLLAGPWKGSELSGLTYTHPFLHDNRTRQIFSADFVTADAGTGLVHIAPGHGQDDYQLGRQNGLPVLAPVDDRGCLTAEFFSGAVEPDVAALVGQYVFKANAPIIEILKSRHALFAQEEYRHDYPHCWRSKTPIVFRAVKQWFIKMDAIRPAALAAIDDHEKLKFIPENGRNRIRGAVESRPDWCISRQRTWGIPLPVFYAEGEQPLLHEDIVRAFATLVEKGGSGLWFSRSADDLITDLQVELEQSGSKIRLPLGLRKGRDTLDVWIDSGTSWAAVVNARPDLRPAPADLYLEGSDQHRGWFQSSLLTSVAATGRAPYRSVLTNGFVVDEERKKLSKSNEGYQKPVDLMSLVNEHGADVLRLWVASQDYQDDIPFSPVILARVADTYRSIRNTLRILLGNLADFEVEKDAVPSENWTELDRYAFEIYRQFVKDTVQEYRSYRFSQVYHSINRYCAVELSAFYIDVLKDRMYCGGKSERSRRSAQTVINEILRGLLRLLAPIVPFTADEAWGFLGDRNSVHQAILTEDPFEDASATNLNSGQWAALLELRSSANEKLEEARREKKIGKSLEAHVEIATNRLPSWGVAEAGATELSMLEELFIVSKVILKPTNGPETITVTRAEDHGMKKCVRCWKYWDQIGSHPAHPELCDRCTHVVLDLNF